MVKWHRKIWKVDTLLYTIDMLLSFAQLSSPNAPNVNVTKILLALFLL